MRPLLALALCSLAIGCSNSHGLDEDAGPMGGPDAIVLDVGPIWHGEDGGTRVCPPDINPWNPMDPHSLCGPEGSRCTSGGADVCGSAMSCTCDGGHWNCLVAEPDPVCWCGRQPNAGDRCSTENMACGECCPTAGGNGWPAMTCTDGHWQPALCPAIECPVIDPPACEVDTHTQIGRPCSQNGAACGDACCGNAIVCESGTWQPGPEADCLVCSSYACGDGLCRADQTCYAHCGPTDAYQYVCAPRDPGCNDCSCVHLEISERCEMVDGHPHISTFCG